jgi:hypothetical protein
VENSKLKLIENRLNDPPMARYYIMQACKEEMIKNGYQPENIEKIFHDDDIYLLDRHSKCGYYIKSVIDWKTLKTKLVATPGVYTFDDIGNG